MNWKKKMMDEKEDFDKLVESVLKNSSEMSAEQKADSRRKLILYFNSTDLVKKSVDWLTNYGLFWDYAKDQIPKFSFDSYEGMLSMDVYRITRLLGGINRLNFKNPINIQADVFLIDSYYPMLKTLFEIMVELHLKLCYKEKHKEPGFEKKLADRLQAYVAIDKLKTNHSAFYRENKDNFELVDDLELKSREEQKKFMETGKKNHKDKYTKICKDIFGTSEVRLVRHWYPYEIPEKGGLKETEGSLQWRSQEIDRVFPGKLKWENFYRSIYTVVNTYTHPQMGYQNQFLNEYERMFDLCYLINQFIVAFNGNLFSLLITELNVRPEHSPVMLECFEKMESYWKNDAAKYAAFEIAIDKVSEFNL